MIVPDANLLIYAYNAGAPEHDMARHWWQGCVNGTESVGVPLLVAVSFVRIISNPKAVLPPLSARVAADYMYNWFSYPHITLLQPGAAHWSHFQSLLVAADVRGNLVNDAHIAALALEHNAVVHTNDSDFARFPNVRWHNPLQ